MANLLVPATSLGNVMPIPKGEWSSGTTYKPLNVVTHNNNAYIALLETTAEPTENGDTNWMLIVKGVTKAEVNKLGIVKPDGTTITISDDGTITGAKQVPDNVLVAVELEEDASLPPLQAPQIDADLLGGNPPDYYATAQSVVDINNQIGDIGNLGGHPEGTTIVEALNSSVSPDYFEMKISMIEKNKISYFGTKRVENYTDFNEMTELEVYYSTLVAQIMNLANRPSDITYQGHFRLEVLTFGQYSGYKIQRLFYRSLTESQQRIYVRSYLSADYGWSEWKNLASVDEFSNPNLLINPDFQICQRGMASYTTNKDDNGGKYYPDRWRCARDYNDNGLEYKIQNDGLHAKFIVPAGSYGLLKYSMPLEDAKKLSYKKITLSCNISLNGGTLSAMKVLDGGTTLGGLYNRTGNGIQKLTFNTKNIANNLVITFIFFHNVANSEVVFHWCKLEIGGYATTFVPPNYADEIEKCRYYYKRINKKYISASNWYPSTHRVGFYLFFDRMRAIPTAKFYGNPYTGSGGIANTYTVNKGNSGDAGWESFPVPIAWSFNIYNIDSLQIVVKYADSVSVTDTNYAIEMAGEDVGIELDAEIY